MKKRTKIIVLISSVLLVSTFSFLLLTHRFNADTIMGPLYNMNMLGSSSTLTPGTTQTATTAVNVNDIINSHITAGSLFASAYPEQGTQAYDNVLAFAVSQTLATQSVYDGMKTDCAMLFTSKYKPSDITSNTPDGSPIEIIVSDNESCLLDISDFVPRPESKPPWATFKLSGWHFFDEETDVILPTAFKSASETNSGNEIQKSSKSISVGFEAELVSWDSKWQTQGSHLTKIKGDFSNSVVLDMAGSEDLLKSAVGTKNLDPAYNNYWRVTTTGIASLEMEGTFEVDTFDQPDGATDYRWLDQMLAIKDAIKFTKLQFCPTSCQITIKEELDIKATRNDVASTGTILSKADHQEVYTGTGGSDPAAKKIFWKSLKLDQSDKRNWEQNLKYTNGSLSHYTGSIYSIGTIFPLLKNQDRITSNVTKDIKISYPPLMMMMNFLTRTYSASTTKKEVNWDGVLSRSGTSTISDCYKVGTGGSSCGVQSGIFDSISPLVKITSPASQVGQRVDDPFSSISLAPYLVTSYGAGSLYVPGLFTASYNLKNNIATIATRPAKSLPTKLYLFKSYAEGDSAFTPKATKPVYDWAEALKSKISSVVIVDTTSEAKLKAAFSNIESGSWVVNMGHGWPDGLVVGGEEVVVSYKDIYKILKTKGVKIDVFAGATCYVGRSNIGGTTVGSLGVGMGDNSTTLGTMVGIGTHSWNYAISDLIAALNEIIEKSK